MHQTMLLVVNYDIYDKELLAIIFTLKEWRCYLVDAKEQFEVWSDHKNLSFFRQKQFLNQRQARWYEELAEYDFVIHHIPGTQNSKADILSRLPQYEELLPEQREVTMLDNKRFESLPKYEKYEKLLPKYEKQLPKYEQS